MAFNFENRINLINSFVSNLYKESAFETTEETSTESEDHNCLTEKVIELDHVRKDLVNIETRLMEHENSERLKTCRSLLEKEANILTLLNGKFQFLNEELLKIKLELLLLNNKHKNGLRIPKDAQKDFLETIDILSDFNHNLKQVLENNSGNTNGNLNNLIEVYEKNLAEIKQKMCVLNQTYNELSNNNIIFNFNFQ